MRRAFSIIERLKEDGATNFLIFRRQPSLRRGLRDMRLHAPLSDDFLPEALVRNCTSESIVVFAIAPTLRYL
jgi:hypothetical protein